MQGVENNGMLWNTEKNCSKARWTGENADNDDISRSNNNAQNKDANIGKGERKQA